MAQIGALKYFLLVLCMAIVCDGKVYTQCEFAKAMKKQGISNKNDLATWTCIAYYESSFNSKAHNKNTGDYGILQISQKYWCSTTSKPGKDCNVTCNSLLSDDITNSIKCAKKIYSDFQRQRGNGFLAWVAYKKSCRGNQVKWISKCSL